MHYSRHERGDAMYEDGSIIIDSEIRTDGVEIGTKEVEECLKRTTKTLEYSRAEIQKWIEDFENGMDSAGKSSNEFKKEISRLEKELKKLEGKGQFFGDDDYDKTFLQLEKVKQALKDYKQELTSPTPDAFQYDTSTMEGQIERLTDKLTKLHEQGKTFGDSAYDNVYKELQKAQEELRNYKKELMTPVQLPVVVDTSTMEGQINLLRAKLEGLKNSGLGYGNAEFDATARDLKMAEQNLAAYKKQLFMTEDEQAAINLKLAETNRKLEETRQKEAAAAAESARLKEIGDNASISNIYVVRLREELERLSLRQKDLEGAGLGYGYKEFDDNAARIGKLNNALANYKKRVSDADKAQKKVAKSSRSMNRGLKNTTKNAGRARMSLTRMMGSALLISFAMRAVMTVMAGFGEGLNNLVQYSDDSNRAMSALMSGMTQLKNTFATAFSPLIEYVQPALSKFINLLAEAVTWTAQFFAALTGKDTFVKAVKVQQDYAESLDKTKDETKDAAKETQKALAPFDELIQIISTKTDSSDKNELKPEDMFTTEEVTNQVKGQAQAIKDIFSKIFEPLQKSWSEHGEYAVSASKAAFDSLKQLATDIGASFLQVWNDEGYGEVISGNLIVTFGNLANTVANLARQFDEAWVKADNGTNIIRHLGDILVTISDFFRQASEEIRDWAAELDFEPLLKSFDNVLVKMNPVVKLVGDALLWLLKTVLLPVAKWALECAVPAVLDLIAVGFDLLASVLEALEPLAMWLWDDFLQPFGEWAGKTVIAAIEKVVNWLTKFSDWIREHQTTVENITLAVLAFFAAWKIVTFVVEVMKLVSALQTVMAICELLGIDLLSIVSKLGMTALKFGALTLAVAGIISVIAILAKNWNKMSPSEKVVASVLAAAAAVGVLAVALGAIKGALGAAAVAAAIVAGVGAATIAVNAGKRQVESMQASAGASSYRSASVGPRSYSIPHLATGTVVPPRAGEFLAVLGDNKHETEVVSPLSTMKQAMLEALEAYGGMGGGNNRPIQVDMYLDRQRLGRVIYELNNQEKQRVGVRLVTEG